MGNELKRILVINPFGIGDVIFSMTLTEELRRVYPKAKIGFLCNERTVDLVRLNTSIDQTFVFHRDLFRRLWKKHPFLFYKKLKGLLKSAKIHKFDTVFDLSLGREYAFFCWLIGIKTRIGFNYKGRGTFLTHKHELDGYERRKVADIQMDLLSDLGIQSKRGAATLPIRVSLSAAKEVSEFLKRHGVVSSDRLLALAPGGGKSWGQHAIYKQWDPDKFAEAATRFIIDRSTKVILLGDKSEQGLLEKTALLLKPHAIVIAGAEIENVCVFLQRSEFLLCNDGGLLHLANALGVKTISIFGPSDEKVYGPYGNDTAHEVVTEGVLCRPCYKKFHFPPCAHDRCCLQDLSVDKVTEAMKKIA